MASIIGSHDSSVASVVRSHDSSVASVIRVVWLV